MRSTVHARKCSSARRSSAGRPLRRWHASWRYSGVASRADRSTEAGHLHPWYQDPTVLSALIGALAIVLAAIVTGLFGLVTLHSPGADSTGAADEVSPAPPITLAPAPSSPITFEAFLDTMASKDLTELQRKVFLEDHLNRRVEWEGIVRNVTPAEGGEDKRYLLGLAPGENAPEMAACWFAAGWGGDLLGLKPGQRVIVTGVLSSYDSTTPVLRACSLKRI